MRHIRSLIALAALCVVSTPMAQQAPADEPGWAKGRPKTETAQKMAPVAAFPVPTPADQLPVKKFKLPPGFKVEIWASGVLDARGLRQGEKGNVFVSSLFVANKVYVIPEKGNHEAKVIIDKMPLATGIELQQGQPVPGDEHEDPALRQHRGQAGQARRAEGAVRQAAGRHRPQLEVPAHPRRQAVLRGRCAVQHLRSGGVGQDLPHEPRRQRTSRPSRRACAIRWASTSTRKPATCGSPTTAATGSARSCPTTSSTT